MNKLQRFATILKYVLKYIALLVFYIIKFVVTLIPVLLSELFKLINQRLRFSITFKTTAAYTLIFTLILILIGAAITGAFGFFLLYRTNISLDKNQQVLSQYINENTNISYRKLKNYAAIEGINITLRNSEMQPVYISVQPKASSSNHRTRLFPNTFIDSNYFYREAPVKLSHDIRKIELTKSLAEEKMYLTIFASALGASFLLAILITIITGSSTSRKMLRPIDKMTRTARLISVGDLETRLDPVDSHDELKDLALTFNAMLDRIQSSFEQQNVFVSDASHELRTPISVIQGYANLLQRWGKEDPAVLEESITAIKSEADYMKELVEKLLFLASADKKKQPINSNDFALHELIDEVLKESQLIDSEHNISGQTNDHITFSGDRALIKQALRIFIDNSRKFTPAGGSIQLNSFLKANQAIITIEDNGIGIKNEDLPYIFNRFYKADKSRAREGSGAGLGLSISKWIIEQHQGNIKVESYPQQGTKIIVTLPVLE